MKKQVKETGYKELYLLGILNSRLISWFFGRVSNKRITKTFPRISILDIKNFPVPTVDFSFSSQKSSHDHMVSLVSNILDVNNALIDAKTEQEKSILTRRALSIDKQIDELVFQMYGLTVEEIRFIDK